MPRLLPTPRRAAALAGGLLTALVLVAAGFAPSANAACNEIRWQVRWQPDPFGGTGGSLVQVPVCYSSSNSRPGSKPISKQPAKAKAKRPTVSQYRALRFRRSASVSATVRRRMIEQLAFGEQADAVRTLIASGDLTRQFNASLRESGWSARDLGDMYTLAFIHMWLVANGQTRTSTAVDRAVRDDLRRQLALDRKLGGASDRTQQETAEWLGSWAVVLAGSLNTLHARGDAAAVNAFRDRARELIRSPDLLGVDLQRIRLTRHGIARR